MTIAYKVYAISAPILHFFFVNNPTMCIIVLHNEEEEGCD